MFDDEVMETEVDESVDQEVAEPEETEGITDEGENEQEVAEPVEQSKEENSRYADIRRRAEAEAQRKMDKKIEALCKDVTHPITGLPIRTFAEYEDAIAAQERLQTQRELESNGLDIDILDNYVNASPVLREARQIVEQNKQAQAEAQLKNDFEELQRLNPDLKTFDDLGSDPNFQEILMRVQSGASLVDAYKIVNFDTLMTKGTKGAKQAAINQARGKSHLEPTDELADGESGSIDESLLAQLKANFPEKTPKQIRELYKLTFK